jgi:hypothetical protein
LARGLTGTIILDTGVEVTVLFDWRTGAAFVAACVFLRRELDLDVISGRRETITVVS